MLSEFKVYGVLPSADLSRARAWYEEKTGTVPTKEDPGGLWYECVDGTWFVVTRSAFAGTAQNTAVSFQVTDIEAVMAELRDRGVVFEEYDLPDFKTVGGLFAMGPYKAAWFRDADGNTIEISEVAGID
jgi:catechol 2,3-dioxygenase-like lactoylglutathione lyase family enzyme